MTTKTKLLLFCVIIIGIAGLLFLNQSVNYKNSIVITPKMAKQHAQITVKSKKSCVGELTLQIEKIQELEIGVSDISDNASNNNQVISITNNTCIPAPVSCFDVYPSYCFTTKKHKKGILLEHTISITGR
jgi:hypothetical protein